MPQPNVSVLSPWATLADVCPPCDNYEFDPAIMEDALLIASEILYGLAPIKYPGIAEDVVRPCARPRALDPGPPSRRQRSDNWSGRGYTNASYLGGGVVSGWVAGGRWGFCSCNREAVGCFMVPTVRLPGPVVEVREVKIDGVALDASAYRVDNYQTLVRVDGQGWPCCQHVTREDDQPGTFSVRFVRGCEPPFAGVRACASLACQMALAMQPSTVAASRLPRRVQSMTRQGVTVSIADWIPMFEKGMTGLVEVDLWLASERTKARNFPALIVNPEVAARGNYRTGT